MRRAFGIGLTVVLGLAACTPTETSTDIVGSVNVYTARHYDSDAAIYDAFTKETGIEVNLLEGNGDQLIQRIRSEAEYSPADVFITVDAGRLDRGVNAGIFQPITDDTILSRVPDDAKDPEGNWIGLTRRARVIVYNADDGLPAGLETYSDLADPSLRGELCMRTSSNPYNLSLLASIIAHKGEVAAEAWARGVVENFKRPPQGNDVSLLKSVAAGECGITIANTYYIARIGKSSSPDDEAVYAKLGVLFPNQESTGAHFNISGIGLVRYAPNKENAEILIEYLTRADTQAAFSAGNNEYPTALDAEIAPQVMALGEFKGDTLSPKTLAENQAAAVRVFDRAGWK